MKRDRSGQSSERGQRLIDQIELQLDELEVSAAEDDAAMIPADTTSVVSFSRKKPVRTPLPAW
jgi:transposase